MDIQEKPTEPTFKLKEGCGFYFDVFDKAPKIREADLIPIASRVRYTHQAAVVRWKTQYKMWRLSEPRQDWFPSVMENEEDEKPFSFDPPADFWRTPLTRINKNVVVWTQVGIAYVFGFVKRGIGESQASHYRSGGLYGEADYDPGYFDATKGYVPLYALKSQLRGVDYFFSPLQSVEVI